VARFWCANWAVAPGKICAPVVHDTAG